MTLSRTIVVAGVLAAFAPNAQAQANSLNDNLGPREIAVGESMRAESRGAMATTLNPSGLSLNRELVFEGSYGYRTSDGATIASASACDSTVPTAGCFYYRYFKSEPVRSDITNMRRAHEFGLVASRMLSPKLLFGLTSKYFDWQSDLMEEEGTDGFGFDAGLTFRVSQGVNIGAVGYNLWGDKAEHYPRGFAGAISMRPDPALVLGFDALYTLDTVEDSTPGRYGAGMEYFVAAADRQSGYPLRMGVVHDTSLDGRTYLTGGFGFLSTSMGLDVGVRKQVDSGDELTIQAGLRFFGPRLPTSRPGSQY